MAQAKEILVLIVTLTSGVIGYFFGHVPAEAHAARADANAKMTETHARMNRRLSGARFEQMTEMQRAALIVVKFRQQDRVHTSGPTLKQKGPAVEPAPDGRPVHP